MTLINMTLVQELCALPDLDIYIQIFILLYSPYLCDSFALCLVLNGAVVIELYEIKFRASHCMYYSYGCTAYGLYIGFSTSHPYRISQI